MGTKKRTGDDEMRDVLAMAVLSRFDCRGLDGEAVAARCYEIADAMIEERPKAAERAAEQEEREAQEAVRREHHEEQEALLREDREEREERARAAEEERARTAS